MKLNPFSNKSSAYYDKAKAEYGKLDHEFAGLRKQLESAKAEETRERSIYDKLRAASSSTNSSAQELRQHQVLSEAYSRIGHIETQISQMDSRIFPLRRIVEAPEQYTTAKKKLEDLLARQTSLNSDLAEVDALLARRGKRIADIETRIASETKAAAQSPLNKEGEFAVPESLTKLGIEFQIGKTSQVELESKREALVVEQREISNAISEAKLAYNECLVVVTEIELHEQLMPIMDLFARAAVARHLHSYDYNEQQYEIEIPHELIELATAALAAEMPTA
jgi:predicted  nucleic acid-binding Zn-ribbon protein